MSAYRSCSTCAELDLPGYCAPLRCYCGHEECTAYPSYVAAKGCQTDVRTAKSTAHHAKSWAEREEETWLDRL